MRKIFGTILIVLGCLSFGSSLWFGHLLVTADTTDDRAMIAQCEEGVKASNHPDEETQKEAIGRCVEDGWKAMGMVAPIFIFLIIVFGILAIVLFFIGRRLYRNKASLKPT
jgi:disulfide bond formation protein DsbB